MSITLCRGQVLLRACRAFSQRPLLQLRSLSSQRLPQVVRPSAEEVKNSRLNERNLEIAVRGVHLDGLVVVEDVVPHHYLDSLNIKMVEDARILQARGEDGPFNYNVDPIATQITSAVLGPRPKWTFCSGNTAMPPVPGGAPQRQPVHADADFAHPEHPFALVVNVPLIDMTPHNGSTEVWLGTHTGTGGIEAQEGAHGERASGRIKQDILAKRVATHGPPVQPNIKKGSVVIRDLRLWHAGMPNRSEEVRVMLAQIHFASWYRNPMRLEFAEDVKPILEGLESRGELGLEAPTNWVSKQQAIDGYLNRAFGNAYDFNQAP
ncbi:hypothetical protein GQX73_g10751 [Xylaria multiplex]|uniref:Kanamycin B dioxygenase n=1 Tax=Xylaria multiplex TaxID=323545 RepID=A0A7C8IKP1_9PEZI|nr:hypothetical protein GQX73_g10751 [Xylaria multiplex]